MQTLVLFDSMSGNTAKVAQAICDAIENARLPCHFEKINKATDLDFYDYDLIFIGSPVIDWLPTKKMMDYIKARMKIYNQQGLIKPAAPIIPGKFGVCFGTFGGPHIGEREATPMTLWLRAFLEHLGYIVMDQWHIPGRFNNRDDLNQNGRMGNIQDRPDPADLTDVQNRVTGLLASLSAWRD